MRPELEAELERRIRRLPREQPRVHIARMVEEGLIQNPKQAWRTLEKWTRRGRYNYGVSLDTGWMEPR